MSVSETPRRRSWDSVRVVGMIRCLVLLACLGFVQGQAAQAQTVLEFWHSQSPSEDLILRLAEQFNASQTEVRVLPRYNGTYQESAIRLVAALGGDAAPVLFDAEVTVIPRLVEEGALADLSAYAEALPAELLRDLEPRQWEFGVFGAGRYSLPWAMSLPVLYYNASAFAQLGLEPPATWAEFEAVAERLTTRNTRGYIDVAAAFIFEALVTTRGGSLVSPAGEPRFDSPEAVDALSMLQRMSRARTSVPRGFAELDQALVDFARTKGMMAIAAESFFPQGERFSVAFEVAAAPLPQDVSAALPLMGAQLVVLAGSSEAERAGAFAFWEFLMNPEHQSAWVQDSYALPARLSVAAALQEWYAADPGRGVALEGLPNAVYRPRVGAYVVWQGYLQEAIERATKAGADPATVLREAQRRALESP